MNNADILGRFDAVERMLRNARIEHGRSNHEDALEFLRAAQRNIQRMQAALERGAEVVSIQRKKIAP